ncbi:MAG: hypothetical protein KGJ84_06620 [Elusimicrobia bacterium]|nr:hypothetical protein [Elusimicrobiota bacterium]
MRKAALALLLVPSASFAFESPKSATEYLTAEGTADRLTRAGTLTFADFPQPKESDTSPKTTRTSKRSTWPTTATTVSPSSGGRWPPPAAT